MASMTWLTRKQGFMGEAIIVLQFGVQFRAGHISDNVCNSLWPQYCSWKKYRLKKKCTVDSLLSLATLGTSQSVVIRGMVAFQGWICTRKHTLGHFEVASFQGSRLQGVHCVEMGPAPVWIMWNVWRSKTTDITLFICTAIKPIIWSLDNHESSWIRGGWTCEVVGTYLCNCRIERQQYWQFLFHCRRIQSDPESKISRYSTDHSIHRQLQTNL